MLGVLLSLSLVQVPSHPTPPAPLSVAIAIYPGVELLDFAGPGEVFSSAHVDREPAFRVFTVAATHEPLLSQGFVKLTPTYSVADCPETDIVVIPGGDVPSGSSPLGAWVAARAKENEVTLSVCNGALLLGEAGLLKGLEVTTHRSALERLALVEPTAKVFANRRFVDNGRIVTSAGVSAGIDGALQVVSRLCGEDTAWKTARYMEYDWRPDEIAKLHAEPGRTSEPSPAVGWVASVRKLGVDKTLVELRKQEKPPAEAELNRWGYQMINAGRVDDALALLELANAAFPASANAADSLSEVLERKGDAQRALSTAKDSLARLERETAMEPARKKLLHNAAASRVARLTGRGAELAWKCQDCGGACDEVAYLEGGQCPGCPMQLVRKDAASKTQ
jgi:putative intracellular protease/amidase